MNKKVKVILNVLIGVACVFFLVYMINMFSSFKYRAEQEKKKDTLEVDISLFEYKLRHKAYNEILSSYHVDRLDGLEVPKGYEDIFRTAEYAHTAFMRKIYEAEKNEDQVRACTERMQNLKKDMGKYKYTADEVEEILRNAP